MSADNWAICPGCRKKGEAKAAKMDAEAQKKYGVLTPDDYLAAVKKAVEFRKSLDTENRTLREDYELGVEEDGQFRVNFRSHCTECGFDYGFNYSQATNS